MVVGRVVEDCPDGGEGEEQGTETAELPVHRAGCDPRRSVGPGFGRGRRAGVVGVVVAIWVVEVVERRYTPYSMTGMLHLLKRTGDFMCVYLVIDQGGRSCDDAGSGCRAFPFAAR